MPRRVFVTKDLDGENPDDDEKMQRRSHCFFWQMLFNVVAIIIIFLLVLILFKAHYDFSDHRHHHFMSKAEERRFEQCESLCHHRNPQGHQNTGPQQNTGPYQYNTGGNTSQYVGPVCGSNRLTYASQCRLNVDSCKFPEMNLVVAYNGECMTQQRVALIGGLDPRQGNVYTWNVETGNFGPVCDDAWNLAGANIVCKQLGFLGALNATIGSAFGLVTPVFSYDDVKCIGFESTIDDCPHIDEDDCGPDEAAGVICDTGFRWPTASTMFPGSNITWPFWYWNFTNSGNNSYGNNTPTYATATTARWTASTMTTTTVTPATTTTVLTANKTTTVTPVPTTTLTTNRTTVTPVTTTTLMANNTTTTITTVTTTTTFNKSSTIVNNTAYFNGTG